jgi:ADP-heptose:LPS heptosyltransferase
MPYIMKRGASIERLAIVYPKAIGDFLFILPALHTIRRAFPGAHITLVIKQKQAPLAKPQKGLLCDDVLILGRGMSWRVVRRQLAAANVDTVIDMVGNDQSGLLLSWRGGRRIRPHRTDCKGLCAMYSPWAESMPPSDPGIHRVDELLAFARYLGAHDPVYSFQLQLPDQAVEASERMIAKYDLRSGTVVALNLGASRDTKRWPAAHIRTLVEGLIARGLRVVLMGAAEFKSDGHWDRRTVEQLRADGVVDDSSCIDLVTEGDLPLDLHLQRDAHFLRYANVAEVVVGDDTGALHIAGSVGEDAKRKTVSLFGPTNWGRYAPYDPSRSYPDNPSGDWNRVLCADVDCLPRGTEEACRCYRKGCVHKQCMHELSPDRVLECVMEMVKA